MSAASITNSETADSYRSRYTEKLAVWLIDTVDWDLMDFDAVKDIRQSVLEQMNSTLLDSLFELSNAERQELQTPLWDAIEADHVVCSLCIVVLSAHDGAKTGIDQALHALAARIISSLMLSRAGAAIATAILRKVLQAGANLLWQSLVNPDLVRLVRFIGADCSDWSMHPDQEIFEYCVAPLLRSGMLDIEVAMFREMFDPGESAAPSRRI